MQHRDHLIDGEWVTGKGDVLDSVCPATGDHVWTGTRATSDEVDAAMEAARAAWQTWSRSSLDERIALVRTFAEEIRKIEDSFARLISREMGKPLWEARTEVAAVIGKVELSISALQERRSSETIELPVGEAVTRYAPYGVLAILGPFNLPAHLPNGHIVPALLAGNTIVFKPSDQTPAVAELMVDVWNRIGLPAGVLNLVQGGVDTAKAVAYHDQLDGLLFTGSYRVGLELSRWYGAHPERILALEMGGNNPLVVDEVTDVDAAAHLAVQSAFITSGQRCTCARRLILVEGTWAEQFLHTLSKWTSQISVGAFDVEPEPFMGPVVSSAMAKRLVDVQSELISHGAKSLVPLMSDAQSPALLTPGIVDVTSCDDLGDEEWFGPLLQIKRVPDWAAARQEANRTSYGLAAGLISESRDRYEEFRTTVRAGIVNFNRQTTGASGRLPFGGVGYSGNHRPSGYHAIDYCNFPVASLEVEQPKLPENLAPGLARPSSDS